MSDFNDFFERATRSRPFRYQRRLAEGPDFPELLQAPTGTGKTAAAVLGWLWRRRDKPRDTPRRLVYCLPMRVLVDQTRSSCVLWLHRLAMLAGTATFDAAGKRLIQYKPDWAKPGKIAVAILMGGESDDQWREYPEREAILIGTQDMLISRALNRGYSAWPQDWPVEFGLLNIDTQWVLDEVQLMGPARTTSAQLQLFSDYQARFRDHEPLPLRRTLWMSATLGAAPESHEPPAWMKTPEWRDCHLRLPVEGGRGDDLVHPDFNDRWTAAKQLELHIRQSEPEVPPRRRRRALAEPETSWTAESTELVNRILEESRSAPGRTVLVFVNRVDRARALADKLRDETGNRLPILLHARFRPRDRKTAELALTESPAPWGRIIVSTQVLEAGADIDADALFTELCPWPSMVQRLGRLNRRGRQKEPPSPAVVFDIALPKQKDGESATDYRDRARRESGLPYDPDDLDLTRQHLASIAASDGSLSPEALSKIDASIGLAGPILRRFDLDDFFDTDPDLAGGHTDVSPFVRAIDREVDAYVLWRNLGSGRDVDEQPPVHPDEICPAPFHEVREAFASQSVWILTLATRKRSGSPWRRSRADEVRPGDTVMVDLSAGCYTEETGWLGKAHSDRKPSTWVDSWQQADGSPIRAWVGGDSASPTLARVIDDRLDSRRASGEDPGSYTKHWMELDIHLGTATREAELLAGETSLNLPPHLAAAICTAASWHDVGKALERQIDGEVRLPFQNMLRKAGFPEDGHPRAGVLYAKSNRRGGPPSGFRHEVASALAYLTQPEINDLAAYLILAHHGKVRLLPSPWDDDPRDANGVRPHDRVPAAALPDSREGSVCLDPGLFLSSPTRSSWQGRVGDLLKRLGPFGLAYLEALIRVVDWRAS